MNGWIYCGYCHDFTKNMYNFDKNKWICKQCGRIN